MALFRSCVETLYESDYDLEEAEEECRNVLQEWRIKGDPSKPETLTKCVKNLMELGYNVAEAENACEQSEQSDAETEWSDAVEFDPNNTRVSDEFANDAPDDDDIQIIARGGIGLRYGDINDRYVEGVPNPTRQGVRQIFKAAVKATVRSLEEENGSYLRYVCNLKSSTLPNFKILA